MIGCSERFFFATLDEQAEGEVCPLHLLSMAHWCIGVYCRIIFAVEELSFEPRERFILIRSEQEKVERRWKLQFTDFAPVIRALCDLVAGLRRLLLGVPAFGVSISAAFMIASRLELVGADIDALLILYCGFDEYSSAIAI